MYSVRFFSLFFVHNFCLFCLCRSRFFFSFFSFFAGTCITVMLFMHCMLLYYHNLDIQYSMCTMNENMNNTWRQWIFFCLHFFSIAWRVQFLSVFFFTLVQFRFFSLYFSPARINGNFTSSDMPNTRWYDGKCNFCGCFEFISYVCKFVIFIQFNLFDINTFHV